MRARRRLSWLRFASARRIRSVPLQQVSLVVMSLQATNSLQVRIAIVYYPRGLAAGVHLDRLEWLGALTGG